jgi:anti-sigma factor RsiW
MSRHGITSCLDDDTLVALLDGRLGDAARTAVLHPLEPCSDCRLRVADAGALGDATDDEISGAARGSAATCSTA